MVLWCTDPRRPARVAVRGQPRCQIRQEELLAKATTLSIDEWLVSDGMLRADLKPGGRGVRCTRPPPPPPLAWLLRRGMRETTSTRN